MALSVALWMSLRQTRQKPACIIAAVAISPTAPAPLLDVRETHLDNGLKVLVSPVHTAPLVSVWCWYRVGSRDERPGLTGASHWVEHMNFKGTTNIPRDQMKGLVERFGGMWNGYTWIDQTTYLETAGTDALDQLLFIEAERMANGLYEPDDCESERTVIISELQGGENDPDQLLDQEVTAMAFRAHPYRHPTIGWLPDLRSMTRDDLYGHYRRYYIPNNATLVVAGDVDADDVLRRVGRTLGAIPSGPEPPRVSLCRAAADRRAARGRRETWHDGLPEAGLARARGDRSRLLSDAGPRRGPDRGEGDEPLVELPRRAAAAQGAAVHEPGRAVARRRTCLVSCVPTAAAVPVHDFDDRHAGRRPLRRSNRQRSRRSSAFGKAASATTRLPAPVVSFAPASSSRPIASRTSRTSSGTSRR